MVVSEMESKRLIPIEGLIAVGALHDYLRFNLSVFIKISKPTINGIGAVIAVFVSTQGVIEPFSWLSKDSALSAPSSLSTAS